jgi:hypothetical protein
MNEALASERPTQPVDRVMSPDDPRWTRLHSIIEDNALLRGDFTLSSGRRSSYFFQSGQASLHREGARLIGGIIVGFMRASSWAAMSRRERRSSPSTMSRSPAGR